MTKVEKSIYEKTKKIDSVKKIVLCKSSKIKNVNLTEGDYATDYWKTKKFTNKTNIIRIGTVFSGIGVIEHAFQRLKLNYNIIFAGDIDPNCKKSYFANYNIYEEKIK